MVRQTDLVVLLAVSRSRVDRAGALFERDVVAQDADRRSFQEGMFEKRSVEARPLEGREHFWLGHL